MKLARSIVYGGRDSIGGPSPCAMPTRCDYNLWAGPAPLTELKRPKFHYDWHWFWDTGNGEIGNNNIHSLDICRWGLGVAGLGHSVFSYGGRLGYVDAAETPNTQVAVFDFGSKTIVSETRGLKTLPFHPTLKSSWFFYGTEGIIAETDLYDLEGKLVRAFEGKSGNHFTNFLQAVRSRKQTDLAADILEGHQSTALCHIANISFNLGSMTSLSDVPSRMSHVKNQGEVLESFDRTKQHLADAGVIIDDVKLMVGEHLRIDGEKEQFVNNPNADRLLTRVYRNPFIVPKEYDI